MSVQLSLERAIQLIRELQLLGRSGDAAKQTGVRRVLPSHADSSWGWGKVVPFAFAVLLKKLEKSHQSDSHA
jgi:hypothetical protein